MQAVAAITSLAGVISPNSTRLADKDDCLGECIDNVKLFVIEYVYLRLSVLPVCNRVRVLRAVNFLHTPNQVRVLRAVT